MNYAATHETNETSIRWYYYDGKSWDCRGAPLLYATTDVTFHLWHTAEVQDRTIQVVWLLSNNNLLDREIARPTTLIMSGPLSKLVPIFEAYARML